MGVLTGIAMAWDREFGLGSFGWGVWVTGCKTW